MEDFPILENLTTQLPKATEQIMFRMLRNIIMTNLFQTKTALIIITSYFCMKTRVWIWIWILDMDLKIFLCEVIMTIFFRNK